MKTRFIWPQSHSPTGIVFEHSENNAKVRCVMFRTARSFPSSGTALQKPPSVCPWCQNQKKTFLCALEVSKLAVTLAGYMFWATKTPKSLGTHWFFQVLVSRRSRVLSWCHLSTAQGFFPLINDAQRAVKACDSRPQRGSSRGSKLYLCCIQSQTKNSPC